MHLVHVVRCRSLKSFPNLTLAHCSCNMSNMSGPLLGAGLVPKSCWKRGKDSNFPSRCSPSWRIWSQQAGEQNGFAKPQGKLGTTISAFLHKHFVSYHHRRTCQAVQSRHSWGCGSYKVRRYQLQQLISIVRFDNELRWSLQHSVLRLQQGEYERISEFFRKRARPGTLQARYCYTSQSLPAL